MPADSSSILVGAKLYTYIMNNRIIIRDTSFTLVVVIIREIQAIGHLDTPIILHSVQNVKHLTTYSLENLLKIRLH